MTIKNLYILIFVYFVISFSAYAENIMGTITNEVQIRIIQDIEYDFELGIDELAAIYIDDDTRFLKGINIEFQISDTIKNYADGFIISIYNNISPGPHENMNGFTGTRIFMESLPYINRSFITIPVGSNVYDINELTPGVLGVTEPVQVNQFPILVQIQPVMKGLPELLFNDRILFTFKPEIERKGILNLNINKPDGYEAIDVIILLDSEEIVITSFPLILRSGIHSIKILSDVFNEENISVAITPGNTENVDINLEQSISALIFNIEPLEGASIFLDGEKIDVYQGQRIVLTTGEHTIRFKLGSYSVSKRFTIILGRNYEITFFFDIDIKEN